MKTIPISSLHRISSRFMRSTQLERDFDDVASLEGYIVTPEIKGHLQRIGKGLKVNSGLRSWRITGDFGSGKSSFALLLANLLGKPINQLPVQVKPLLKDLDRSKSNVPYLPVLVTGSREELSLALLEGLHKSAQACDQVDQKLKSVMRLKKLYSSSKKATDKQVLNIINDLSKELVLSGEFGGVLIVLDELGKFLEYAALHPDRQDVFFLQQLGELSSRSGEAPVLAIGLLHQGFSAYADKLSDSAQKEWEKVGGRYEGMTFTQPLTQVAALIASALNVTHDLSIRGWKKESRKLMREAIELGVFGGSVGKSALSDLAPDLYPIHPTVLPVLNRFFRRFGQNERSLFSFLLSSEPHALPDFSSRTASCESIYTLADFYNYAAENFSHRLAAQSFRSHWNHIDAVIRAFSDQDGLDIQILKTVGILNIIESEDLRPTRDLIALSLGHPEGFDERLDHLAHKLYVLFDRGVRRGYSLWPNTSVNLEQAFIDAADKVNSIPLIAEVAAKQLDTRPIVARRHYINSGTLRHFSVRYLTVAELSNLDPTIEPVHPEDGILGVVLCERQDDCKKAEKYVKRYANNPRLILAISPPLEGLHGHALDLARWTWIQQQHLELKDDRFALEEVARQVSTIADVIHNWLHQNLNIRGLSTGEVSRIRWFYAGGPVTALNEGGSLQTFLSDLCSKSLFPLAPVVRNELINRHAISASAAGARQKLFVALLKQESEKMLGFPEDKAPPEKSIYLSFLLAGRLHRKIDDKWQITFPDEHDDPCQLLPALEAIVTKLESKPDARVPLSDLYSVLRSPQYGVRDGLIPLLLLIVFIVHESEIAIYEDDVFVAEVEEFMMMRLARAPHTFEFQLCRINTLRRELVDQLASILDEKQAPKGKLLSIVRPLCLFVDGLPEYVNHTDELSSETLKLRQAIQKASEPSELIFQEIPKALGFSGAKEIHLKELTKKFKASIIELRRAFPSLQDRMAKAVLASFEEEEMSLNEWRISIAEQAETVIMGLSDPDLRAFCMKLIDENSPQTDWLESLGSLICRKPASRWRDRDELVFNDKIKLLAGQFNRVLTTYFDENGKLPDSAVKLAITRRSGEERDLVVKLSSEKLKQAEALREELKMIMNNDRQVSLAALSHVMWDLLEDSQ